MINLFLICGIPGSGKSTFLKEKIKEDKNAVIVSRDEIRFSLVKPDEEYFSHENEVYKELWKRINTALKEGKIVYVDQTSLSPKSRKYLLDHITENYKAGIIWLEADVQTCLNNNELRKGTRAYVPRGVIRRMAMQFIKPTEEEGFTWIEHYKNTNNEIKLIDFIF